MRQPRPERMPRLPLQVAIAVEITAFTLSPDFPSFDVSAAVLFQHSSFLPRSENRNFSGDNFFDNGLAIANRHTFCGLVKVDFPKVEHPQR